MRTKTAARAFLFGVLLLGIAPRAARAQDEPLDAETKTALAKLATPERGDAAIAEKVLAAPGTKAVAAELLALTRKDPKDHATHEAAGALLAKLLEPHADVAVPPDPCVDLAEHDSPGCRRVGVKLLREVLKLKNPIVESVDRRIDQALEARVEAILAQIETLAKAMKVDELLPCFVELNEVMETYGRSGRDTVRAKLKQWNKRLDEWKEIRLAVGLQAEINEGNAYLKEMVKALQQEHFAEVVQVFGQVETLVTSMRAEEREEYHRNADAILVRATKLRDEAQQNQKLSLLQIVVNAVVIDPRPESKNRAIIRVEGVAKIYEEGDALRDRDDRKVETLVVVKIAEDGVTFTYGDLKVYRELKSP